MRRLGSIWDFVKSTSHRTLVYEKNLCKRYGDTFVDLGIQQHAARLSKEDVRHLRGLMRKRAYGEEKDTEFQLGENYPEP